MQQAVISENGLDVHQLYAEEGLDAALAADPEYRYPAAPFNRVWLRAEQELADDCLGITAARFVIPTTFHALGLAMWSSASLDDALKRLVRYARIFHTGARGSLEEKGGHILFRIEREIDDSSTELATDVGVDCFIAALIILFRQLLREPFAPAELRLRRSPPVDIAKFTDFYQCPVIFEAGADSILFNYEILQHPLPSGNALLASINDRAAEEYLSRFDLSDLYLRLTRVVASNLENGDTSIKTAAREVGMSVRSLQRALRERNTSYKEILNLVRSKLAKEYLLQSDLSLGEISYRLRFSHVNNFIRAFRAWFGESPTSFRRPLASSQSAASARQSSHPRKDA